jgi:hypothetical protein
MITAKAAAPTTFGRPLGILSVIASPEDAFAEGVGG